VILIQISAPEPVRFSL